jgi:serine/threonine protein kinase
MPKALVYWAPELLRLERFTHKADIWALGVTLYQIITGEQPFNTLDEEGFRNDVMSGNLDWSRLATSVRLRIIVEQTLQVDPNRRWDASFILSFLQEDFAIEIQKAWRGYYQRKRFKDVSQGLVKIQSLARGYVVKRRYEQQRAGRRAFAVVHIQSAFRGYLARRTFNT